MSKSRKDARKFRDMEALALILRGAREHPHEDRRAAAKRKACRKWKREDD